LIFDGNLIRRFLRSRFSHVSLGAVGLELRVNFWHLKTFRANFVTPPIQTMFSRRVRQAHNLKVAGSNPAPATKNPLISVSCNPPSLRTCEGCLCLALCLVAIRWRYIVRLLPFYLRICVSTARICSTQP